MSDNILLIHGTWCNGGNWGEFATQLQDRGFTVHAPSLRHHGRPGEVDLWANAQAVAKVGLLDYVADLASLVEERASPPIIVGHSVGALLAQLLAARVENRGVVLLGPAPAAGIFAFYPGAIWLWGRYMPQWLMGKPMYPVSLGPWRKQICNSTSLDISDSYYSTLCAESGTAYRQMCLWFLDPKRSARVDFDAVQAPVLVVTGSEDRCTAPAMGRATANKYGKRAKYVEIEGSDHMMTVGRFMPTTLEAIDRWLEENGIGIATPPA